MYIRTALAHDTLCVIIIIVINYLSSEHSETKIMMMSRMCTAVYGGQ